ncbi:urease accessory protein UreF [Chengkuizengella axinellae]|uniref:Urease accessory protein UreF n=1 Tax=Chengkuizengella axinellae TaxID=3064388 RepID=A0ABT9IX93_9BACL|nr:urease accessory protein UreF [Chengkuizengella sp. 2205SS18-9]MDP5273950.1 urease accessory protein UreF [Chengkuizengella sp. 2205SS18-9]
MKSDSKLLFYVQILDSALPIGGFSHSFGLETYIQDGKINNLQELESFIHSQIHHSLVRFDSLAIKGIYESIQQQDYEMVFFFDQIINVQRTARESREALLKMGKRLLKLAHTIYPWMNLKPLKEYFIKNKSITLPTVHTYIAFHLGIGLDETVKGYCYTNVVTTVNSALRLMSIGQTDGQVIISRAIPVIEEEWGNVKKLNPETLHSFAPEQEIYAMNHETLYSRLFMS